MAVLYCAESAPRNLEDIGLVIADLDMTLLETSLFEWDQNLLALQWARQVGLLKTADVFDDPERINFASTNSNGDSTKHYQLLFGVNEVPEEFWPVHEQNIRKLRDLQQFMLIGRRFLELLAIRNVPIIAFTSRRRELLDEDHCPPLHEPPLGPRKEGWFDEIISADDVTRLKPDPEGIELIHQKTGVPYKKMVMIGDRTSDTIPAKKKGARAIAIAKGTSPELVRRQYEVGSDMIVERIYDIHGLWFPEDISNRKA
jgi:phosphoglycolate phosphatase-like HAD superfamily hydrolase